MWQPEAEHLYSSGGVTRLCSFAMLVQVDGLVLMKEALRKSAVLILTHFHDFPSTLEVVEFKTRLFHLFAQNAHCGLQRARRIRYFVLKSRAKKYDNFIIRVFFNNF